MVMDHHCCSHWRWLIGPVLYLLPTRKDRRLAAMRLEARRHAALSVELKLRAQDRRAGAMSASAAAGERRARTGSCERCLRHDHCAPGPEHQVRPWRLLAVAADRGGGSTPNSRRCPDPELLPKWSNPTCQHACRTIPWPWNSEGGTLACYWLERFPADADTVRTLKTTLSAIGETLSALDAELTERLIRERRLNCQARPNPGAGGRRKDDAPPGLAEADKTLS